MLKTRKNHIDEMDLLDIKKLVYCEIPSGSDWKIEIVKEYVDYNSALLVVPGFQCSEIEDMVNYICTS